MTLWPYPDIVDPDLVAVDDEYDALHSRLESVTTADLGASDRMRLVGYLESRIQQTTALGRYQ